MASFTRTHRYAYHVFPLHALKPICKSNALLPKESSKRKVSVTRNTSAAVDIMLGFTDYIHFYLPRGREIDFSALSILRAQLSESKVPAFPHIVLVVDSEHLVDLDCTICNFNIACSRPAYPGVKGGNHDRRTPAEVIQSHWKGFKDDNPVLERRRYGEWTRGLQVPVMTGSDIGRNPRRVGFRTNVAELLIRDHYKFHKTDGWFCFSDFDLRTVSRLPDHPPVQVGPAQTFEWYSLQDRVAMKDRQAIERYFDDSEAELPPQLDFDQIRPKRKNAP